MSINIIGRHQGLIIPIACLALLAGCSSSDTDMIESLTAEPATPAATPAPAPVDPGPTPAELAEQRKRQAMLAVTRYYFDFDKSDLKSEAMEPLRYHAQRIKENPSLRVILEGHADERGTTEYNLALGERRALAVQQYLLANGVSTTQLEIVSYGEARPTTNASTEQAWSSNRRVELKF